MKTLLMTTTAILFAAGAQAHDHMNKEGAAKAPLMTAEQVISAGKAQFLVSEGMDQDVYDMTGEKVIAEVEDFAIDSEGKIAFVVIEMEEDVDAHGKEIDDDKEIAVPYDHFKWNEAKDKLLLKQDISTMAQ